VAHLGRRQFVIEHREFGPTLVARHAQFREFPTPEERRGIRLAALLQDPQHGVPACGGHEARKLVQ
jgi:hypothetical protein